MPGVYCDMFLIFFFEKISKFLKIPNPTLPGNHQNTIRLKFASAGYTVFTFAYLWETGSSGAVLTGWLSLYHSIEGVGVPDALQLKVTGSFLATVIFRGCSKILGPSP